MDGPESGVVAVLALSDQLDHLDGYWLGRVSLVLLPMVLVFCVGWIAHVN